jgi:hypothetical protein
VQKIFIRRVAMRLLVCSTDQNRSLKFMQATSSLSSDALSLDLFQSLESFFERLQQPIPPNTAALIVTGDAQDLGKLVSMAEFLWNLRVIVALPDDSPETLSLARRFWPRYIASADSDFSDVAAVLKKMASGRKRAGRPRKETIEVDGGCEIERKPGAGRSLERGKA